MKDVPVVSEHKGKVPGGGGDALDPGQVLPPSTWPGSFPDPAGEIVILDREWLAWLKACLQTGELVDAEQVALLILLVEDFADRRDAVAAAVDAFRDAFFAVAKPRHLAVVRS